MLLFFVSTEIGQLWLEYGQMMAILGHLWQTEGTKKLIIINVWVLVRF